MALVLAVFVLGGMCGFLLAAVLFAGSENLEIKRLKMENETLKMCNETIKHERDYWKGQALGARRLHPKAEVTPGGGSDGQKVSQ